MSRAHPCLRLTGDYEMAMRQSVAMAKLIQIHDVPEGVHAELRRRAAAERMSLSAYLRSELERITATPPLHEVLDRIMARPPIETSMDSVAEIRKMRDVWDDMDDDLSPTGMLRRARDVADGEER